MNTDTNTLIKEVAFDILSITTLWGLVAASNASLQQYRFCANSKYFNFSFAFQDVTRLVAMGSSVIVITKYFRR